MTGAAEGTVTVEGPGETPRSEAGLEEGRGCGPRGSLASGSHPRAVVAACDSCRPREAAGTGWLAKPQRGSLRGQVSHRNCGAALG